MRKSIVLANKETVKATNKAFFAHTRIPLFQNLSFQVRSGEVHLVGGPSGFGKSQLLRSIADLSLLDTGSVKLDGTQMQGQQHDYCPSEWRKRVRYVTQYKVDVPGSPRDFIRNIAQFQSWKRNGGPLEEIMTETVSSLINRWSLPISCLDKEWTVLSGGEAQRVILAIALASEPAVLLLDESISALDMESKLAVEASVDTMTSLLGWKTLWVSHDHGILMRYHEGR
jgi:ABC-type iron transport system FetAB ATPase subunit